MIFGLCDRMRLMGPMGLMCWSGRVARCAPDNRLTANPITYRRFRDQLRDVKRKA